MKVAFLLGARGREEYSYQRGLVLLTSFIFTGQRFSHHCFCAIGIHFSMAQKANTVLVLP